MKVVKQSVSLVGSINEYSVYNKLEEFARISHRSEIPDVSDGLFLAKLIRMGHMSIFEHYSVSMNIVTNRAIQNEFVRHRIAAFTVESTRYCNYSKGKFGSELSFIKPHWMNLQDVNASNWTRTMQHIENVYLNMLKGGLKAEDARGILPMDLKTELFVTMNLRSWLNFLELRLDKSSHPQMIEIATYIYNILNGGLPKIMEGFYDNKD